MYYNYLDCHDVKVNAKCLFLSPANFNSAQTHKQANNHCSCAVTVAKRYLAACWASRFCIKSETSETGEI